VCNDSNNSLDFTCAVTKVCTSKAFFAALAERSATPLGLAATLYKFTASPSCFNHIV